MDNGILHQRLEDQLGKLAVLEPFLHIDFAGKPVFKPYVLDIQIPVDEFQLLFQCDKLRLGDAEPEQGGKIRCQLRDLGHPMGHPQPLHGVQGIVEEMGV